ncbi:hypothetical protein V6N13_018724 [Hibiscus sabdariffa]|uniref:Secreted protein n=1 Tax=Hibiscus sabdariffa TaxID=183260 RepID=A0ABR2EL32_9ROSI
MSKMAALVIGHLQFAICSALWPVACGLVCGIHQLSYVRNRGVQLLRTSPPAGREVYLGLRDLTTCKARGLAELVGSTDQATCR